jgi:hypothetical protein
MRVANTFLRHLKSHPAMHDLRVIQVSKEALLHLAQQLIANKVKAFPRTYQQQKSLATTFGL